jgi:hypothetical protein
MVFVVCVCVSAVPWLRRLVADLSPRRSVHLGFMVDKVALGQVFSEFFGFPLLIYHSTVALQTHIIWGMRNMLTQAGIHAWVLYPPHLQRKKKCVCVCVCVCVCSYVKAVPLRHTGAKGERKHSSDSFLTTALNGGEWSASRPVRFSPGESTPGTH